MLVAVVGWDLPLKYVGSVFAKSFLLSLDVMLIVFGAIFFLNYLRQTGVIRSLESQLLALSPDPRVQAILLAWLFGSFIEGSSGFGTPAVIVAPLLVSVGFSPTTAILVSLTANSTAVAFGAVGTPIRIGLAGIDTVGVPWRAALINVFAGALVPFMILAFVVRERVEGRWRSFFECLPWATFAALAFLVPYLLFSFFGQEFPSLFGAAIGLGFAVISLRCRFLVPNHSFTFSNKRVAGAISLTKLFYAFLPYMLLLSLLLLGKALFTVFQMTLDLGGGITHSLQSFNPGFAFLTAIGLLALYKKITPSQLFVWGSEALRPLGKTAVSIFFVSAMTYTIIVSSAASGVGMLDSLMAPLRSSALPFFSAYVGAFGSFLAGSATVSNLLFGEVQVQAAQELGFTVSWILALQIVGAGAGNMIALPNILAVQAAVGSQAKESQLLYRLVFPCFAYLFVATAFGTTFLYWLS